MLNNCNLIFFPTRPLFEQLLSAFECAQWFKSPLLGWKIYFSCKWQTNDGDADGRWKRKEQIRVEFI